VSNARVSVQEGTSNWKALIAYIRQIAGHANVLAVPRIFLDLTGEMMLAHMLAQLVYWSDHVKRADGFIYKSALDWKQELGASSSAVRRFKKLPWVESVVRKANGNPTTHYRVRFDQLWQAIAQCHDCQAGVVKNESDVQDGLNCHPAQNGQVDGAEPLPVNDKTLTETTAQTTTGKKGIKGGMAPFWINRQAHGLEGESERPARETQNTTFGTGDPGLQEAGMGEADILAQEESQVFIDTLAMITGFNRALAAHARRLEHVARQLLTAGYSVKNLYAFHHYWRTHDWRWKKDHQMPTPEDVLAKIGQALSKPNMYIPREYGSWQD